MWSHLPASRQAPPTVLILLLLAGGSAASSPEPPDPFEAMTGALSEARANLELGEEEIAESRFRTALFEGWMLLGRLEQQAGDLDRAQHAFETASASAVPVRPARLALATVLIRQGETDQAELVLRSLIADDTADSEARRMLAKALAEGGRLEESVQELEQLRYLTPADPENAYLLATAYLRQGRNEAAAELLEELARAIPTPQTQILIGRTYRDADLHGQARRALEAALEMDPGVRRAHYYLGTIHLLDQGVAGLAEAVQQFERELELSPGDEMTSLYLGIALVEERRFEEAVAPLETAARRPEVRADALRFLGRALLETGRVEEAIAVCRQGLESARAAPGEELTEFRARQLSTLHYQLAQALRRSGDREGAAHHFAEAKSYQARSAESARESLGRYLADETAAGDLGAPAQPSAPSPVDPADLAAVRNSVEDALARTYYDLGIMQARAGNSGRAADRFDNAAELAPDLPGLQYALGAALFNASRFPQAEAPLSRALATQPDDPTLQQMLAMTWLNTRRYAQAADLLAKLPGRSANPGLQYAYGLSLVRSERGAEAEAVFQQLLAANANWPELNVVLGQAYAQQGDFPSAERSLRRAIELDPEVAEAHGTLGEIHLRRGELEEAEAALRREVALHPGDSRAAYTLATVLDLNQKPDQAMELLRSLLRQQPQMANARYLLGKILLSEGAAEEARDQLEAAAGLAPDDANIHYQLGQAYQRLGRREDAQREFDTFRALKNERRTGEGS